MNNSKTNFISTLVLLFIALPSLAQSQAIITIGDSLTAGLTKTAGGTITCAAQGNRVLTASQQALCKGDGKEGVGGWQPSLKSLTEVSIYNYGNSGESSAQILARLPAILAQHDSEFVLIMAGTNDVIAGTPTSAIIANLQRMTNLAKAAGRTPIVGTIPPLSFSSLANRNTGVLALNAAIKTLDEVFIADHFSAVNADWAAYTSGDFIHFGRAGNSLIAQTWLNAMQLSLASTQQEPEASAHNVAAIVGFLLSEELLACDD